MSLLAFALSILSFLNAIYTYTRTRHYRLFEKSVEVAPPSTPSAHRVRVDSSPAVSSPLRFLSKLVEDTSARARSRAHPDAKREVWEVHVWDPNPISLKLFCFFSPGHVLLYWLFLPTTSHDPRPSVTVATALALALLLSVQLSVMQRLFTQQAKDTALVQKEVMNEYNIKYVHPRTQPLVRSVGTQLGGSIAGDESVDTYSPVTVVNRGFRTNPNPNYAELVDPDGGGARPQETPLRGLANGVIRSPPAGQWTESPLQRIVAARPSLQNMRSSSRATTTGDGGSLGVYSHAQSPLRKSTSTHFAGREPRMGSSPMKAAREGSPLKRTSYAPGANGMTGYRRSNV